MAVLNISGNGLVNAADPLSPIHMILYLSLSYIITSLICLSKFELIPPHKPLSVVIGIANIFLGSTSYVLACK